MKKEEDVQDPANIRIFIVDPTKPFWTASYYAPDGTYHKKLPKRYYWMIFRFVTSYVVRNRLLAWRNSMRKFFHT